MISYRFRFQTTYEELKHGFVHLFCCFLAASRLPMRNWNAHQPPSLNQKLQASRLPMRNWNYAAFKSSEIYFFASRLPMRNWNSCCSGRTPQIHVRFQTTYEELKLFNFRRLWGNRDSFQTTYEELKLPFWIDLREKSLASRLPMRNWNTFVHVGSVWNVPLPDYLWGIETRRPMRRCGWCPCFQTTYEELKHFLLAVNAVQHNELPDYLWGIETVYSWNEPRQTEGLPDYLWGIETHVHLKRRSEFF